MRTHTLPRDWSRVGRGILLALSVAAAGCSLERASAPSEIGPSGYALSLSMGATPDILRRDGLSRSTITLTARDAQGDPLSGRRFFLSVYTSPDAGGTLSVEEVVTASDGRATFEFIAPDASLDVTNATVVATPFSGDFGSSNEGSVRLAIVGPAFPSPSFTYSPSSPALLQPVTFSASATTVDGVPCLAACTYRWEFNDEATLDGEVVVYQFQNQGFYSVKLTVHSLKYNTTKTVTQRLSVGLGRTP